MKAVALKDSTSRRTFSENQQDKESPAKNIMQLSLGISDELMNKFYCYAIELFNERNYVDASSILLVLTHLNPYLYSVWVSLGMSEQMEGDFSGAIKAYDTAILLNPKELLPYMNAVECHFHLGEIDQAKKLFDLIEKLFPSIESEGINESNEFREEFKILKEKINY